MYWNYLNEFKDRFTHLIYVPEKGLKPYKVYVLSLNEHLQIQVHEQLIKT